MQKTLSTLAFALLASVAGAQTVYFHQDFSQTASLVNPQPDTGQFSHVILTAPALSYHKFHKGYMELTRSRQDSATGGIIRALRATPFTPNPETLIVRIRLSVQAIQSPALNALYLYVGEDFNPVNNSFPGNGLMFAKCAMNFTEGGFNFKDLETQQASQVYPEKKQVTLTWVLNNSPKPLTYHIIPTGPAYEASPGTCGLWLGDEPLCLASPAYPGASVYSKTKLSNFEMRFRNGVGQVRIDEISIDDGVPRPADQDVFLAPNPARADYIIVAGDGVQAASARLVDSNGRTIPAKTASEKPGRLQVMPLSAPASGIHLLELTAPDGKRRVLKVMIE